MNAFDDGVAYAESSESSWTPPTPPPAPGAQLEARGFVVEEGALDDGFYARVSRAGMLVEGRGDDPQSALQRAAVLVEQLEHVRSMMSPPENP